MDPLLVITNSEAGPADDEALERALAVLRAECSVEVQTPSRPGERRTAAALSPSLDGKGRCHR